MSQVLISICIPTYNNIINLQKVIDSVVYQTFNDYEIIVSDDSTNNKVSDLIFYNIKKGVKIRYFKNEKSLGSPQNWNYAIKQAFGKYIKILHHDDWLISPDALQKFYDLVSQDDNCFVFSAAQSIQHNKLIHHLPNKKDIDQLVNNPFFLLKRNFIGGPSSMIFPNNGFLFDERLVWLVDVDFYLQLLTKNFSLKYLPEQLYCTFLDSSNITNRCLNDFNLNVRELRIIYNKNKSKVSIVRRLQLIIFINNYLKQVFQTNFLKTYCKIVFSNLD
jgi:glycosyltransferase involved in cell wall biosynthesis